jgi:hypothetical protein
MQNDSKSVAFMRRAPQTFDLPESPPVLTHKAACVLLAILRAHVEDDVDAGEPDRTRGDTKMERPITTANVQRRATRS